MLISKFNLYEDEWLDLVFDDRNKAYGAYELRQHYANTMVKAMLITFTGIALAVAGTFVFRHTAVIEQPPLKNDTTIVNISQIKQPEVEKPKPIQHTEAPKATPPVKTVADPPMVVAPDNVAQKPVTNDQLQNATPGQRTLAGSDAGISVPDAPPGTGTGTPGPDNTVYNLGSGLDEMPEPIGGMGAFNKFLSHSLRFPPDAQEEGISGRVFMSFVIEKDGHLSDIKIDRAAGHGFDEEAMRVLKLAKAWKPGKQNGQAVRVRYVIPINFLLND